MISGLPASGKSSLAHQLEQELDFSVIDRDDFLEGLLESAREFDAEFRSRSSREADVQFEKEIMDGESSERLKHSQNIR